MHLSGKSPRPTGNGHPHRRNAHPEHDIRARTLHRTARTSLEILEHSPGEFDWTSQDSDHVAWVIEGSAEVNLDDGRELFLQPGRTYYLPRGIRGHWVVKTQLRSAVVVNS